MKAILLMWITFHTEGNTFNHSLMLGSSQFDNLIFWQQSHNELRKTNLWPCVGMYKHGNHGWAGFCVVEDILLWHPQKCKVQFSYILFVEL